MIPARTIPSLSGTFGIPSKLALNPKMPKEPSSPSRSNALTADPDKTKIGGKLMHKCLIMNKAQCLTRYIKHLAESANFKGGTLNKHRNGLIGNRFEMPNVS